MFKKFSDMCIHLGTTSQRDGQTDRQTDRQTEILYQYSVLHALARDKNHNDIHYSLFRNFEFNLQKDY